MKTHFSEDFRLVQPGNFPAWRQLAGVDEKENLWRLHDQVVCPLDSIKPMDTRRGWSREQVARYNRERFEDLVSAGWDLVIIDEAHRLGGSSEQVARYRLGEALAQASPYLLLLSATPHQGKTDAFRRRVAFLDADALPDDESVTRDNVAPYVIRTEKRRAIDADGKPLFLPRYTQIISVEWDASRQEQRALEESGYGAQLSTDFLRRHPGILFVLRMFTAPPVARDRLTGLSGVPKSMIDGMDRDGRLPERMASRTLNDNLDRIGATIRRLMDPELFSWFREQRAPVESEIERVLLVVGDRVCRAVSDPVIRNAQEARQLAVIAKVLGDKGYQACEGTSDAWSMPAGTYSFRMNVPVRNDDGAQVNMPIDAVIRPLSGADPVLFEAKSAGDFTNVNKRRKEEATKIRQLRATYGKQVSFMLFLCGYFDTNYLSYEAAEGIDWVWEHRPEELLLAL